MTNSSDPTTPDLLLVGYVRKAHGLHGEVVVRLTTNRTERADKGSELMVGDVWRKVISSRPHQGDHLVRFEGVSGRNQGDELRGLEVRATPLDDPDELWVHELIGCTVVDTGGIERGSVVEVVDNPASDLLELDTGALVPVRFITSLDEAIITVDVPDGLFEVFEDDDDQSEDQSDEDSSS